LVRRGRALLCALAVERPAEHRLGAAIIVGLHALEPLVEQRRLARAAFGDEREYVGLGLGPRLVEALQLGLAPGQAFVRGFGEAANVNIGRTPGGDARL